MGKAVVSVIGCVLVIGACGDGESSPDGDATGGVETGGASSGGAEIGGTAETGGSATGGRASGGRLGSGGAAGAPAECWTEPGAGAPNLGLGGEAGASGAEIEACSDEACETVGECGIIGASLVCVGCTATLPACTCQCYQRFRKCEASCEEFEDCVKECIGLSC